MVFDSRLPTFSVKTNKLSRPDWSDFYKDVKEQVPHDAPEPRGHWQAVELTVFVEVVTVARNSASVELVAVMDCVLHREEMALPLRRKAQPVVDQRLQRSLACTIKRSMFQTVGASSRESASSLFSRSA